MMDACAIFLFRLNIYFEEGCLTSSAFAAMTLVLVVGGLEIAKGLMGNAQAKED
jgi:hypothetical protein